MRCYFRAGKLGSAFEPKGIEEECIGNYTPRGWRLLLCVHVRACDLKERGWTEPPSGLLPPGPTSCCLVDQTQYVPMNTLS